VRFLAIPLSAGAKVSAQSLGSEQILPHFWADLPTHLLFFGLGKSPRRCNRVGMLFWSSKNKEPKAPVLQDIRSFWGDEQPHRWKFILASIALTTLMMVMALHDFRFTQPYKAPEIDWVRSYAKDRSMADVKADQARFVAEAKAEQDADTKRREDSKAAYRRLAKGFGLPVVNDKPGK
jgi:hypothetical protein